MKIYFQKSKNYKSIKLYEYYVSKNNATTQMTDCLFSNVNKYYGIF